MIQKDYRKFSTTMEDCAESLCVGCLVDDTSTPLYTYDLKDPTLKDVSNCDQVTVCGLCRSHVKIAETFLGNLRLAQTILKKLSLQQEGVWETIACARLQLTTITELKRTLVHIVDTDGRTDVQDDGTACDVVNCHGTLSVKHEDNDYADDLASLNGDIDIQILELKHCDKNLEPCDVKREVEDVDIKSEDGKVVRFEEGEFETLQTGKNKLRRKKGKVKLKNIRFENDPAVRESDAKVQVLVISMQELRAERDQMRRDKQYASAEFRCDGCVKFFAYKETYDRHMEEHTDKFGPLSCDVCGRHARTRAQLSSHRGKHLRRYRCSRCGYTRLTRQVVAEHYAAEHSRSTLLQCVHCSKVYLKRAQLRKHIAFKHGERKRLLCQFCNKTYTDAQTLRSHIKNKHSDTPTKREVPCEQCGLLFKSRSHLKAHMVKHTDSRDFYCVECDRNFKSEAILQQHLKNARPHFNERSSPFVCDQCDLRFNTKRILTRHMNKVHLKILPYKCDRCDKAYLTAYSLRDHIQMIHEGFKRPLRYPCTVCEKSFDRGSILKSHLRTHTGERPYQCPKCPATFAQSGVLHTHNRLIHMRLQRNGEPKTERFRHQTDLVGVL